MRYGDLVTCTGDRLLVHPKELAPIGVHHQSEACGVWLPNVFPSRGEHPSEADPQHLILSPLHPRSWPAVARFVLRLQRNNDALCRALSVLADLNFNILSYDCTPSGYHHLTWTIIAEATDVLSSPVMDRARTLRPAALPDKKSGRDSRYQFANEHFAPAVLRCLQDALNVIRDRDRKDPFLHQSFVTQTTTFGGQLYNHRSLPDGVRGFGEQDSIRPASVSWVQSLAFFWLYGANVDSPLTLGYDSVERCLACTTVGRDSLSSQTSKWFDRLPVRSVAMFDPSDRYCRIFFSDRDEGHLYAADFQADAHFLRPTANTKGLLREVFSSFGRAQYLPLHATHTIRNRTANNETTGVAVVGIRENVDVDSPDEDFLNGIRHELTTLDKKMLGQWTQIVVRRPVIRPLRGDWLFLSTKAQWINEERVDLRQLFIEEAAKRGFELRIMDNDIKGGTTSQAVRQIKASQAFLQVLPRSKGADGSGMDWISFERGVAECAGLPWAMCVDPSSSLAKVLEGRGPAVGARFEFNGRSDPKKIARVVASAIGRLRHECDVRFGPPR